MNQGNIRRLLTLLFLWIAALLIYYPSLHRSFIYDDILVIRDNDFITHPGNLLRLYGTEYLRAAGEQTYRPLVTASYFFDYWIWHKAPFGYGLTNLLLHVLSAWLLGLILLRMLPERQDIAFWSAVFYLSHPALVEAVISPGNREEILSVFLLLLSAWFWFKGQDGSRSGKIISPCILFLSLLVQEWGVILPVLLAFSAIIQGKKVREAVAAISHQLAVAALYLILMITVFPKTQTDTEWLGGGPFGGLLVFGTLFWKYVRLELLPFDLRPTYIYSVPPLLARLAGLIGLLLSSLIALWGLMKCKPWALGMAVFGMALLPVSHVFMPFWIPMAERYLVLPLLGGIPLLAAVVFFRRTRASAIIAGLIALFFALGAGARAHDWRDGLVFWQKAAILEPSDMTNWTNLGASFAMHGQYPQALAAHRRAWDLARKANSETPEKPINVANALTAVGQKAEACRLLLNEQLQFGTNRDFVLALGRQCGATDREASEKAFGRILRQEPDNCEVWADYCGVTPSSRVACLQQAIPRCPQDGRLWLLVAAVHAQGGDQSKTVTALQKALLSPQRLLILPRVNDVITLLRTHKATIVDHQN